MGRPHTHRVPPSGDLLAAHGRSPEQGLPLSARAAPGLFAARPQPGHARQPHSPQAAAARLHRQPPGNRLGQGLRDDQQGKMMPGRNSLFWKLAILLIGFCLAMIALTLSWGQRIGERTSYLSDEAKSVLSGYAERVETAWRQGGASAVDAVQSELEAAEG